ncbi:hypothetical protein FNN75_19885 [Salmonella enterica subsp. arizonae]|nr:hypothetical protein [Salmonella enterica subsp. arizonae]EDU9245408.1 hypothetical protein [Salmonella enterica]
MKSAVLDRRFYSYYYQHINLTPFTIMSSISVLTSKYKLNICHIFICLGNKIIQNRTSSNISQGFW